MKVERRCTGLGHRSDPVGWLRYHQMAIEVSLIFIIGGGKRNVRMTHGGEDQSIVRFVRL